MSTTVLLRVPEMAAGQSAVFRVHGTEGYEFCTFQEEIEFGSLLENLSAGGGVPALSLGLVSDLEGLPLKRSNAPQLTPFALVLEREVRIALQSLVGFVGCRVHGVACAGRDLDLILPPVVPGALDWGASDVMRFSTGRVMDIERHVFVRERVEEFALFRIEGMRLSPVFLSRSFVEAWEELGFVGLDFCRLWRADGGD